jgi:hypothetical protein
MSERPIILVCGCRKYEEYLHAALRRFDRPDFEVIGILGGKDGSAVYDPTSKILSLPVSDTYEALPTKIHAAFAWIAANRPGIPGVFKTDDDMVFDMNALTSTILSHTERAYWGVMLGVSHAGAIPIGRIEARFVDKTLRPSHQSAAYCFGWGYWISATALPLIVAAEVIYKSSYLEDMCTGYVMNTSKIMPTRIRTPYNEMERTPELLALK